MTDKATTLPVGTPHKRTYRAEAGTLTEGTAVIQGTADDQAKEATTAAEALGIVDRTAIEDAPVSIVTDGEVLATAGAQVAAGEYLKVHSSGGKLVPSAGEDTANVGRAISSADGDGDQFVMYVRPAKKRS